MFVLKNISIDRKMEHCNEIEKMEYAIIGDLSLIHMTLPTILRV